MNAKTDSFWDRHADGYARRKISNEDAYQQKLKETRSLLRPDMDIFEFGCGTGTTALHHAPYVRHVYATDISARMIDIATAKAAMAGVKNVTFRQGDITDMDVADRQFDVVMGHSILHLVDDRRAIIAKAWQMLKPGGFFITSTACLKGRMSWLKPVLSVGHLFGLLPRVAFFSSDDLLHDMGKQGFVTEDYWQPSPAQAMFVIAWKPDQN